DGAAWHKAKKIQGFNNLSVLVLLPASPELNPVEQIWQQLQDNWLANRC
ncbi:MAG: transposase, partial [Parachlamydiaceae bacterium]